VFRGAQAIFALTDSLGPVKRVFFQRGKHSSADIWRNDLKGRAAPVQNKKRSATPRTFNDPAEAGAKLLRVNGFEGRFHVQLKINF
jgi:hypothetical protein